MDILLTGASSFLGRHLASHLVNAGHMVFGTFLNGSVPSIEGGNGALLPVRLDLANSTGFTALPERVDAVIHVAGISQSSGVSADEMLKCNVDGTRNVLRFALSAKAKKVIYTSSLSIHGRITVPVVDETTPIQESDLYGVSKYLGERLFAAIAQDLPSIALRLPGVLGRGAHRAWVPTLLANIRNGKPVTLYNPDSPFNNAVHIDDLNHFISLLLINSWTGFHPMPLGAAGHMKVSDVAQSLAAAIGTTPIISIAPSQQAGFIISSDMAIDRFGYRPMNIKTMIDHYSVEG